jgi:dTDP-4-dehydrorhamnose 3,5-epimerase
MKVIITKFKGLKIIKSKIFYDNRGYFREVIKKRILGKNFLFDCMSESKKNVLRGLHFQKKNSQAKLVTVTYGKIFDVVVDLRKNSKTFGKYFSIILSDKTGMSIMIPKGFAHGFYCMSSKCIVYYKCTKYRDKNSEMSLAWNDENIKIKWPSMKPILSTKDSMGISIKEV